MSDKEILVVVSKLKTYVKSTAGMNTAGNVAEKLSDIVRGLCDEAADRARKDGRKTLMDRDF
jgi:histone H3/H4